MFIENERRFNVGPVRHQYENRPATASKIKWGLKRDGYKYALVRVTANGRRVQVSWSDQRDSYDYGLYVCEQLVTPQKKDFIYVEQIADDKFVVIRIDDGVVVSDETQIQHRAVQSVMHAFEYDKERPENMDRQLVLAGVTATDVVALNKKYKTETYNARFSVTASEQDLRGFRYFPIKEALKTKGFKRPNVKYVWGAIGVIALVWLFFPESQETTKEVIAPTDEYQELRSLLTASEVSPINRMREDYNAHILMQRIPGWELVQVEHVRDVISYTVQPVTSGGVRMLQQWANENGFGFAVIDNAYTLLTQANNIPVHQVGPSNIAVHDLEQVTRLFSDAVELWVPGARISVQRDQVTARAPWRKRDISLSLQGHYKEDLLTIAAIIEALDLPIAIQTGQYQINNERMTGTFTLSIYGE